MNYEEEFHKHLNKISEQQNQIEHCHEKMKALLEEKSVVDTKNYDLRKEIGRLKRLHESGLRMILTGVLFLVGAKAAELFSKLSGA